jgi:alpha-beta hydrolase superfamily lysophospholipase
LKTTTLIADSLGKKLHTLKWIPGGDIKAVVQIVHGIAEHAERYNHFANFLTRNGFAVYAHDHQGHGKTDPNHLGYVEDGDAFELMVKNVRDIYRNISIEHPGIPHILFGHSMGSFLVQRYMQISDTEPDGIIYSGSNGKPPVILGVGIMLANLIIRIYGPGAESKLIHKMIFGPYNKHFKPNNTELDWLTRDPEMVQLYIDDPFCNFIPSVSFFGDLFKGLKKLHSHKPFADHSNEIPIMLLAGDSDPVSGMGKGIKNLEKLIRKSGIKDIQVKLYPGGRHEMLNETNRDEVMNDLLSWISIVLKH